MMGVMDVELKRKWLEALRSGRYKQGRFALKRGDEYCCLGILCEVGGLREIPPKDRWEDKSTFQSWGNFNSALVLPRSFRDHCKISALEVEHLAGMNDRRGTCTFNFTKIADWIEENL